MSIARTTLTDDDGTGTTGTVVNNAWLQAVWDTLDGRWSEATTTATGNQDNVSFSEADVLRCNNATTITLRGLLAPTTPAKPGKPLILYSLGAGSVVLNNQDANSTAANRLITGTGAAVTLTAGSGWAVLVYDSSTARWRVLGTSYANVNTTDTQTLSNKRIAARKTTIVSSATPTINTDNCDAVSITALATAITSMTSSLSGTPFDFDKLIFRILDNGTARGITWGASFVPKGAALPTTTVISKLLTVGFIYDSVAGTWGCVASSQEA